MKVRQARLAQAIRGETSNLIDNTKYDLNFDKGMLTAKLKTNPRKFGDFVIFPANIAYIETEPEVETTGANGQKDDKQLPDTGASKKK